MADEPTRFMPFTFEITYFKRTGKAYTSEKVTWNVRISAVIDHGPDKPKEYQAYLPDVVAKVRGLRDTGGDSSLPGLTGTWDGPILVQEYGVDKLQHLILPEEWK